MKELKVFEHDHVDVVDSRDVAEMVERRHDNLLRDISGYIRIIERNNVLRSEDVTRDNELGFSPVDFFIPSTYKDSKGETRPCYLITKKGCDMVANKMTGEKGVLFTAAYVTAFEKMQEHIQRERSMTDYQKAIIEARERRDRVEAAKLLNQIAGDYTGTYRQILQAYAAKEIVGKFALPLPEMAQETYTAEEIGAELGISANMVGRIANSNGLKTEQYGKWFVDKAKNATKEVRTFRYFENVVPKIEAALETVRKK